MKNKSLPTASKLVPTAYIVTALVTLGSITQTLATYYNTKVYYVNELSNLRFIWEHTGIQISVKLLILYLLYIYCHIVHTVHSRKGPKQALIRSNSFEFIQIVSHPSTFHTYETIPGPTNSVPVDSNHATSQYLSDQLHLLQQIEASENHLNQLKKLYSLRRKVHT